METPLIILLNEKGFTIHNISPKNTVLESAVKMSKLMIGALIVLEKNKLVGVISERDILRKLVVLGKDAKNILVEEIMTRELITVAPTTTVREGMRIVTDNRIRHLPVMDEGKLIGVISIGDLTRWAMLWQEQQISSLTNYIQGERNP